MCHVCHSGMHRIIFACRLPVIHIVRFGLFSGCLGLISFLIESDSVLIAYLCNECLTISNENVFCFGIMLCPYILCVLKCNIFHPYHRDDIVNVERRHNWRLESCFVLVEHSLNNAQILYVLCIPVEWLLAIYLFLVTVVKQANQSQIVLKLQRAAEREHELNER